MELDELSLRQFSEPLKTPLNFPDKALLSMLSFSIAPIGGRGKPLIRAPFRVSFIALLNVLLKVLFELIGLIRPSAAVDEFATVADVASCWFVGAGVGCAGDGELEAEFNPDSFGLLPVDRRFFGKENLKTTF